MKETLQAWKDLCLHPPHPIQGITAESITFSLRSNFNHTVTSVWRGGIRCKRTAEDQEKGQVGVEPNVLSTVGCSCFQELRRNPLTGCRLRALVGGWSTRSDPKVNWGASETPNACLGLGEGGLGIYAWASNRRELYMFSFPLGFLLSRNTYSMHMVPLCFPPRPLLKKILKVYNLKNKMKH